MMPQNVEAESLPKPKHQLASSPEQAQTLLQDFGPAACYLCGGTAAQLDWPAGPGGPAPGPIVDISRLAAFPPRVNEAALRLSAFSRLETLRGSPVVQEHFPMLRAAIGQVAAKPIRNLATLGGNIGWRFGDLVPLLLAAQAHLLMLRADGEISLSLAAALTLPALPLILEIIVPLPLPERLYFKKIQRRAAFSPAVLTIAMSGPAHDETLAIGGAGIPARLVLADTLTQIRFQDDIHASASYRQKLLQRLVRAQREMR